jgi:hypothetical protein
MSMATTAKAVCAGSGLACALAPARIVKSVKKFHQGDVGFHAGVLNRGSSDVIDLLG